MNLRETHQGSSIVLYCWVIMNLEGEDPRGKANTFKVLPYSKATVESNETGTAFL